jgi:hypothetical protein
LRKDFVDPNAPKDVPVTTPTPKPVGEEEEGE